MRGDVGKVTYTQMLIRRGGIEMRLGDYARLPAQYAQPGTAVTVEVFGEWVDAAVTKEPLLDPAGERVRA